MALEKSAIVVREQTTAREKVSQDLKEALKRIATLEARLKSESKAHAEELKAARRGGAEEGRQEGWLEGYAKGGLDFLNSRKFTDRIANALLPWIQFGMRVGCCQMVKRVDNPEILPYTEPDYDDDCGEPEPAIPEYVSPPSSPLRVSLVSFL